MDLIMVSTSVIVRTVVISFVWFMFSLIPQPSSIPGDKFLVEMSC